MSGHGASNALSMKSRVRHQELIAFGEEHRERRQRRHSSPRPPRDETGDHARRGPAGYARRVSQGQG